MKTEKTEYKEKETELIELTENVGTPIKLSPREEYNKWVKKHKSIKTLFVLFW